MTIGRPRFRTVFWLFAATATVAVWWAGIDAFEGSSRRADSHFFWDGSSAAIMFGMAIIGQLAAAVTGGLLGTRWRWRTLGVVALAPFGALVATFAVLSATGGRCPNDGGACTVSLFQRYGGLLVTLSCIATAAATQAMVSRSPR